MSKNWKKFIDENREGFNDETPSDVFFEKIAPNIKKGRQPKMIRLSLVIQVAAAVVIILGLSLFFILMKSDDAKKPVAEAMNEPVKDDRMVLAKIDPGLAETEYYYVSKIDRLMKEVDEQKLTEEVKELIEQLDKEFTLLRKEMGEHVNSQQIIEAMIENYRLKLKLLEKILNTYNDSNNTEHEKETIG